MQRELVSHCSELIPLSIQPSHVATMNLSIGCISGLPLRQGGVPRQLDSANGFQIAWICGGLTGRLTVSQKKMPTCFELEMLDSES